MKIAIPFKYLNKYNEEADEFNINFDKDKNNFNKLLDFVDTFKEKRINISFPKGVDISVCKSLSKIAGNVYFKLSPQDVAYISDLREIENCKFFFNERCPVYNLVNLNAFINAGVTDVYIADDLWYNLNDTKKVCDKHNVNIRAVLNRIPSTSFDRGFNPRTVFFRPEDYDVLSKYIDTCEFDCGEPYDWHLFNVLYKTWFIEHFWYGSLKEINKDLRVDIHNRSLQQDLSEYKLNCGYRCFLRAQNVCNKCNQFLEISDILHEKGFKYKRNKDNKETAESTE